MTKAELSKAIGKRVIELREKKGWKQSDLAKACGKKRSSIKLIEEGSGNPTAYSLYVISKCLEVPLEELVKIPN